MAETTRAAPSVFFLRMAPSWEVVDEVRRFVERFCATACPGEERQEQLALAAHELVQNAVANAASPDVEFRIELDRGAGRVRLSVSNGCSAEQIAVLRARLTRAQAHRDPLAGYLEAMRESPGSRGGLGFSRIRYEGALELGLEVRGGRVTVHAAGSLGSSGPATLEA